MNIKIYTYFVVLDGIDDNDTAVIYFNNYKEIKNINKNRMHLLDDALIKAIPLLEYCLHLPRTEIDVCDCDITILDRLCDCPQNIIICPSTSVGELMKCITPDIIFCDNTCYEKVKSIDQNIECVRTQDLSTGLLKKHWLLLFEKRNVKEFEKIPNLDCQYLLNSDQLCFLPMLFTSRQYGKVNEIYYKIFNSLDNFELAFDILYNQNVHHLALMSCSGAQNDAEFKEKYFSSYKYAEKNAKINVVITFPGISKNQKKYAGLSNTLSKDEKNIIRVLGVHRAIAKNALLIELLLCSEELFDKLNELEINCKQDIGPNNKYIHRILSAIGNKFEKYLSPLAKLSIEKAKEICVFSDFPLGLCILGDSDNTLQCQKELSSRTLTPLTRNLQIELAKHREINLSNNCKILFLECIPNTISNKKIIDCSKLIIKNIEDIIKLGGKFEFIYKEANKIADFKKIVNENEADILIVSAHGFYKRENNISGIMIGNEEFMVDTNDFHVPPIVLLSACHVSPRGNGCVSAADLFVRAGAEAVLSTFIPINAFRNAVLISRFINYLAEAQKKINTETLLGIWSHVVNTNAVIELMEQSNSFKEWMMEKNSNGVARFYDFCLNKSVGRLRKNHIYFDTIQIIKEMMKEENMQSKFDAILDFNDYFPESFFYEWIGYPENITFNRKE